MFFIPFLVAKAVEGEGGRGVVAVIVVLAGCSENGGNVVIGMVMVSTVIAHPIIYSQF